MIGSIWGWIKAMVANLLSKLPNLLPRRQGPQSAPHVDVELEKKLARDIKKKRDRLVGRGVDTRHGGPNMPKYQPCDICGRGAKRVQKTSTGAKYHCKKCNNSMVIAAR